MPEEESKPGNVTSTWVRLSVALIWFVTWAIGGMPVGCGLGLIANRGDFGGIIGGTFMGGCVGIVGGACAAVYVYRKNK